MPRIAIGLSYDGSRFHGWQSQRGGNTVQDVLEKALGQFAGDGSPFSTLCSGRTDAGVHGLMQVVHFETPLTRDASSWVRGTNRFLPPEVAVQWAQEVPPEFHARACATSRRYAYVLLQSPVRPSIEALRAGWTIYELNASAMQAAAAMLLGEHDFSSFRAAQCQALSPVKTLLAATVSQHGAYWRFDFEGTAFLHHMIRNILGCLVAIGSRQKPPEWMQEVLAAKSRDAAAPTFAADGLYFLGPRYGQQWSLPERTVGFDLLPGGAP